MSYLAQVIATAGEAEVVDLKSKITEAERKIAALEVEVKDYFENNYAKFAILLQENHLMIKAKDLISEIDQLQERVNSQVKRELESSVEEVKNLVTKLKETDLCLRVVKQLLDIDDMIKAAEEDQNRNCYLEAAKKFKTLNEWLTTNEHIKNLHVYESLASYVSSLQMKFINDSLVVWNKFITWEELQLPNNLTKVTLTINNFDGKSDVICVLMYYDYLDYELKLLSRRLFDSLLKPIVKYKTSLKVASNDGISEIILEFREEDPRRSTCDQLIQELSDVFSALFESLDAFIGAEETFVNKLGELLETEFCECLVENCLYQAIPTKKEEFTDFDATVNKIVDFDNFLKENGFLKPTNKTILDYVSNINNLFVSKICQTYLITARKIFDQDLHDMVQVSSSWNDRRSSKNLDENDLSVCKNTVAYPNCYISKSSQQLLQLIKNGLKEITSTESINNLELFHTMRNIISLYCDLMPLKHDILLKSIPQQAALFFNNCMYLAHELATLGIQFSSLLQENIITTFVDFIDPLRSLAYNILNSQIDIQRQQLLEILSLSELSSLVEQIEFPPSIEKSLRQCIRQLVLLQSVWQNILPQNMYCKAIGMLCNAFVEKLIDSVLQLNDITLDTASQLTNVFTIVQDKIPALFYDSKEIFRHVKLWSKFNELLFVLNGSLKDIDDRWADGKGPLAQEFSPEQIKHLIRALFQHSDRRTALLSRIR